MKLIYIIAQGHTGSTLMDCILGTHPDFISSGEMRYLNWQLLRTENKVASVQSQDICSCQKDFRQCDYWSKVFKRLKIKSGKDIVANPQSFDIAYFNQFSFQNRDGLMPSFTDKTKGYLVREWLELGKPLKYIAWIEPKIGKWLENNWLLYETMSEIANKPFVVDSSKHLAIALLLQQYKPQDVSFIFVHRSVEGSASSTKRRADKKGKSYSLHEVFRAKRKYEQRVEKYKRNIVDLNFIDIDYEDFVSRPSSFLDQVANQMGTDTIYERQSDENFYIDPSKLHLVAGNPMRYKGRQLVKNDERWKSELTQEEKDIILKWHHQ